MKFVFRILLLSFCLLYWVIPTEAQEAMNYTVQPGDTLFRIARAHSVSVPELMTINQLTGSDLRVGQHLKIPVHSVVVAPHESPGSTKRDTTGTVTYVLKEGETIYSLAARMQIQVDSILRLNSEIPRWLHGGFRIRVPRRGLSQMSENVLPRVYQRAAATEYPRTREDFLLSSGVRYDSTRYLISHPDLPTGTLVLLTDPVTLEKTFAQVLDRSFFHEPLRIDISTAVARAFKFGNGSTHALDIRLVDSGN